MSEQVVIADATAFVRLAVRVALLGEGMEVAAEVATAAEAVVAASHGVDVVLLDAALDADMTAVNAIHAGTPDVAVILLAPDGSEQLAVRAVRAGACGVIPKDTSPDRLPAIVRGVLAGEAALPRRVVRRVLEELCADARRRERGRNEGLSRREQDVMTLLCDGLSDGPIADRLDISATTVRRHVGSAIQKLGSPGRADAVERYRGTVVDTSRAA